MAFDAYCYSEAQKTVIPGETQDEAMAKKKAFEILSFEFGAENNINIGSITGGGAAGKAVFKELSITKKTDTASTGLFQALCTGQHFDDLVIELRRAGGGSKASSSGVTFMKFDMRLVMVQDITWSGSDGDDICEESLTLQYGAIKIHYFSQDAKGVMNSTPQEAMWSRVKNNNSLTV
ncbi:MAG: type VI secretion system secreted protein Hcp [Pseudorhodobacter sp.]|jgi:type VI secretion system secreted protein Hcp